MFTIGEFSRIAGMSPKALRFYHEQGLLVPASVDPRTNYRYYDERNMETARVIAWLRGLEFSVDAIRQILQEAQDAGDLLEALKRQQEAIEQRVRRLKRVSGSLRQFVEREARLQAALAAGPRVEQKPVPPMLVAAVRMKAPYSDCGKGFARIGRQLGRLICGPPLLLHHDAEFLEDAADFEACFPIRPAKPRDGIEIRALPAATCASLLHNGPYDEMSPSYAATLGYVRQLGQVVLMPTREVYLRGPGMIFRGNPRRWVTEIQIPIQSPPASPS